MLRFDRLCERRSFKLFRKVISSERGATLNTEVAPSAAFAVCLRTSV